MGRGRGRGGGGGRGQGMGLGRGYGRGLGRGQGGIPLAGSSPQATEPRDAAPQVQSLKAQAQDMMDQFGAITQRIAEIEATSTNPPAPIEKSDTASDDNRRSLKMTAVLDQERCMNCGLCIDLCPDQAISMSSNYTVVIDSNKCTGCGSCIEDCPNEAISLSETARRAAS
jgi:2-oxoacid:acceptor oxidoreductase delta subunit (pyruvate/2-ketoisovalerate family)